MGDRLRLAFGIDTFVFRVTSVGGCEGQVSLEIVGRKRSVVKEFNYL